MNEEVQTKAVNYVRERLARAHEYVQMHTIDSETGKFRLNRGLFTSLRQYAQDFLAGKMDNRLLILTGLRGSGKTTLFAQVCRWLTL